MEGGSGEDVCGWIGTDEGICVLVCKGVCAHLRVWGLGFEDSGLGGFEWFGEFGEFGCSACEGMVFVVLPVVWCLCCLWLVLCSDGILCVLKSVCRERLDCG